MEILASSMNCTMGRLVREAAREIEAFYARIIRDRAGSRAKLANPSAMRLASPAAAKAISRNTRSA